MKRHRNSTAAPDGGRFMRRANPERPVRHLISGTIPHSQFTLVELLVALALAMIIGMVAMTAFTQTSGVGTLGHARIDAMYGARAAMMLVENDLRAAYIEADGDIFAGDEVSIDMLTGSGQGGYLGPQWVKYERTGDGRLLRGIRSAAYTQEWSPDDDDEVAFNVTGLRFRYYYDDGGTGRHAQSWNSFNPGPGNAYQYRRLPQLVEVVVEAIDERGVLLRGGNEPVRLRRLIEIDAGLTR